MKKGSEERAEVHRLCGKEEEAESEDAEKTDGGVDKVNRK